MKKWFSIALAVTLMGSLFMPFVKAEDTEKENTEMIVESKAYTKTLYTVSSLEENKALATDGEGNEMVLFLPEKFLDLETGNFVEATLKEGQKIVVFFRNDTPILQSYPPQGGPQLIAIHPQTKYSVDMDFYKEDGLGLSNRLILNNVGEAEVRNVAGEVIEIESLLNRELIVLYTISTRSLPPQTNPEILYVVAGEEKTMTVDEFWQRFEAEENGLFGLREVLEAYGAEVSWTRDGNFVTLKMGENVIKIYLDEKKAVYGQDEMIFSELTIEKGTTYLSREHLQKCLEALQPFAEIEYTLAFLQ